jgi:hypothetical protein
MLRPSRVSPNYRWALSYPKVRYNFARYFCASGALKEASEHLKAAIHLDRSLRMKALSDKDLERIWVEFQ